MTSSATVGGVITNFWSIILDDHRCKKIYSPKMIIDVRCYVHLICSCYRRDPISQTWPWSTFSQFISCFRGLPEKRQARWTPGWRERLIAALHPRWRSAGATVLASVLASAPLSPWSGALCPVPSCAFDQLAPLSQVPHASDLVPLIKNVTGLFFLYQALSCWKNIAIESPAHLK